MRDRQGASAGSRGRERVSAGAAAGARRIASASRGAAGSGLVGLAVLALGIAAFAALVAAEASDVVTVEILTGGSCEILADDELRDQCSQTGAERHSLALGLLGLVALLMAWGAGVGRSLPAAVALLAIGGAVLAIVLIGDLPELGETGEIGLRFDEAEAQTGGGFYLALLGGVLTLAAGVLALVRRE